jgi:hypothetical protein
VNVLGQPSISSSPLGGRPRSDGYPSARHDPALDTLTDSQVTLAAAAQQLRGITAMGLNVPHSVAEGVLNELEQVQELLTQLRETTAAVRTPLDETSADGGQGGAV